MTVQERERSSYHGMTPDLWDIRERLREFINDDVIPAEPELEGEQRLGERVRDLKNEAKKKGLWALGHPKEIGGQGMPFMPFCYMNEIIGRSQYGQIAAGSASMQDSIMLH